MNETPGGHAASSLGIPFTEIRYGKVSSVEEAAAARGVSVAAVVKSLLVRRGEDDYLLVLVPGDRSISWPKLRGLLGVSRLSMPDAATALEVTGYERGTITPLGVDLPGLSQTFEGTIEDEKGGKIPFYLYLAAINKKDTPRGGDNMAGSIGTRFRPLFTGGNFTWQRVQAPTPQGAGLQWQHLRLNANQPFRYVSPDGEVEKVEMPGVLELYYRAEGDWLVTIAWRVPQSITGSVELSRWAPLVAGTVKVGKTSGDDPE